jgi:hypothetical protein
MNAQFFRAPAKAVHRLAMTAPPHSDFECHESDADNNMPGWRSKQ